MVDSTIRFEGRYYSASDIPDIRVFDNGDSTFSVGMHSPAMGSTDDGRETDPDAANTTIVALLRGCLQELIAIRVKLAAGIEVTNTVSVTIV